MSSAKRAVVVGALGVVGRGIVKDLESRPGRRVVGLRDALDAERM